MVKKLIKVLPLALVLACLGWVWQRWNGNPSGLIPLPYSLAPIKEGLLLDAPVLFIGDRVGARMGLFKENLALGLSTGLSKPIKIQSVAQEGYGLHRTLNQLSTLEKWPKVILYHGGSEEFSESKFLTSEIKGLRRNFELYNNDTALSAMMLMPALSRLIYEPIKRVRLPDEPAPPSKEPLSDFEYQERLELTYRLYEIEVNRLVTMARDNKAMLILTTTPVNIDIPPRRTCGNAGSAAITKETKEIRELIRKQDYKSAYTRSKTLSDGTIANAEVFYLHGQVAFRNGLRKEAMDALKRAAAFDCIGWRANEVTNNIIRKVAREQNVTLFDFSALVESEWNKNITFFDEIYAQNLYYERAMQYLSIVLKRVLKL